MPTIGIAKQLDVAAILGNLIERRERRHAYILIFLP